MKKKIISGIMVTIFLVTMVAFAFPVRVSAPTTVAVKIGLVGPKGWIQWDGIKEGAQIAADLINAGGGMGGTGTTVEFVEIDEHAVPVPDPTTAVTELLNALDANTGMQYLIGGFRTECALPMREAAMDYAAAGNDRPIWIVNGAATDLLVDDGPTSDNPYDDVRENYERYKYMFRVTPMSSSSLGDQLGGMMGMLVVPKLKALYGIPQDGLLKTYIIAEDLVWVEPILASLQDKADLLGLDIVGVGRPSSIETDYGPFLDAIEGSGAKLIIHVFSAVAGASFIKAWGEREVKAVPVGINVESQMQEFYASIGGACEYESFLASVGTRTNLNPLAKPLSTAGFWDLYSARFGHAPVYTAWGAYDAIIAMNETYAQSAGKTCSWIITNVMEPTSRTGILGYFKYTQFHDVYTDDYAAAPVWPPNPSSLTGMGTVRAQLPQWQAGNLEVVWPRGYGPVLMSPTPLPFAMKWEIPTWMYSLGETDFAGGPSLPLPPPKIAAYKGIAVGMFGDLTSADRSVGTADMTPATTLWQQTVPWTLLEADMDGNQFIDIDDVARVALDWGKTATPK